MKKLHLARDAGLSWCGLDQHDTSILMSLTDKLEECTCRRCPVSFEKFNADVRRAEDKPPIAGGKVWHMGHPAHRGTVISVTDPKHGPSVFVVSIWGVHSQRHLYEVVPVFMWGLESCPIGWKWNKAKWGERRP
jgi:hypothetical protein